MLVKYLDWDDEKNDWLIKNRGISFEMCVALIESNQIVAIVSNKHPRTHQQKFLLNIDGYIYVVPFVVDDTKIYLKTIYPSRTETKKYLPK